MNIEELIEKSIEEEKKTQEAIEILKKSPNFRELFENIEEKMPSYRETALFVDPWDYEKKSLECNIRTARYIKEAIDNLSKAKYYSNYVEKFYNNNIGEWEDYKKYCESLPSEEEKNFWKTRYKNPICLDFFEKYEKAHRIKNSIYQDSKK